MTFQMVFFHTPIRMSFMKLKYFHKEYYWNWLNFLTINRINEFDFSFNESLSISNIFFKKSSISTLTSIWAELGPAQPQLVLYRVNDFLRLTQIMPTPFQCYYSVYLYILWASGEWMEWVRGAQAKTTQLRYSRNDRWMLEAENQLFIYFLFKVKLETWRYFFRFWWVRSVGIT